MLSGALLRRVWRLALGCLVAAAALSLIVSFALEGRAAWDALIVGPIRQVRDGLAHAVESAWAITGRWDARSDVRHGVFRLKLVGCPPSGEYSAEYHRVLRDKYGVQPDRLAYSPATLRQSGYARGYNAVVRAALRRRWGFDPVEQAGREADEIWSARRREKEGLKQPAANIERPKPNPRLDPPVGPVTGLADSARPAPAPPAGQADRWADMSVRTLAMVIATLGVLAAAAPQERADSPWTFEYFKSQKWELVNLVEKIPASVLSALGSEGVGGDKRMADVGKEYDATDALTGLPRRRLMAAGHTESAWFVVFEHGGRGYHQVLAVVDLSGGAPQRTVFKPIKVLDEAAARTRSPSLAEIIAALKALEKDW